MSPEERGVGVLVGVHFVVVAGSNAAFSVHIHHMFKPKCDLVLRFCGIKVYESVDSLSDVNRCLILKE